MQPLLGDQLSAGICYIYLRFQGVNEATPYYGDIFTLPSKTLVALKICLMHQSQGIMADYRLKWLPISHIKHQPGRATRHNPKILESVQRLHATTNRRNDLIDYVAFKKQLGFSRQNGRQSCCDRRKNFCLSKTRIVRTRERLAMLFLTQQIDAGIFWVCCNSTCIALEIDEMLVLSYNRVFSEGDFTVSAGNIDY